MKREPLAIKALRILMIIIVLLIVFIIGEQVGIYQTNQRHQKVMDIILNEGLQE